MKILHSGLTCQTEENADKFYQGLLGLTKSQPKILPESLSQAIFNIASDLKMINYTNDDSHFEIFIHDQKKTKAGIIEHTCLEVENRDDFLNRCQSLGIKINRVPKGDKTLVFIFDFDGNLFEIK